MPNAYMGVVQPSDTHMDLNIGTAFWFASRGEGYLRSYTAAEISALLGAAMGSSGGDGDDDAGEHRGVCA